jgi:multimeric flavodoxin WrbA
MKVVAFNGSARKKGNTRILIDTVFDVLKAEGIETELVSLAEEKIKGCTACMQCFEKRDRNCSGVADFINGCIAKMIAADGVILASPTYFANVSAEMKALIDRAGLVAFANPGLLRHKVGAAVTVAQRTGASQAFMAMSTFFACFEMFTVGSNYPNMAIGLNKGDVEKDTQGLETMRILGKNMAFLLKKIHAPSMPRRQSPRR